ncbi:MAG: hypothetical protein K5773_08735 [Pseudobutyrivibrio sp.]|nr:hypothetical protein [Pseudobutyrivibrio sp.]
MKSFKRLASLVLALALVVTFSLSGMGTMTVEAAKSSGVAIGGVLIQGANVVVASSGTAASDDGLYHLVAADMVAPAQSGADVAQVPVSANANFTAPLNKAAANSLLFKKFTVCVMRGGALTPVSNSMFITNPEACATYNAARMDYSKKGILPALESYRQHGNGPKVLGCTQVILTLPLSWISYGSGVPYQYNGKTVNFETARLSGFDYSIRRYNQLGCQVTLVVAADQNAQTQFLSPYALKGLGTANWYGMNGATMDGLDLLGAAGAFLAERYSGATGHGQVDNFIIGNEVNAWRQWNYMDCGNIDNYTQQYANSFRMLYNGIKSGNGSANVYVSLDQQWAKAGGGFYPGKTLLTKFNDDIRSTGNIDWRVATHAYSVPLTNAMAWAPTKNLTHSQSSPFISVQNLEVLTDFLSQPSFLSPSGAVRTVKLSEQGWTSLTGEQYQAASIIFGYMAAMKNSHVDGFILSREYDENVEIAQGLANGLRSTNDVPKLSYTWYQNADSPDIQAQASAVAGVDFNALLQVR